MHGENHAKETVLIEVDKLQTQLNEKPGDSQVQGAAISILISMVRPIFQADLQTIDGCKRVTKEICEKEATIIAKKEVSVCREELRNFKEEVVKFRKNGFGWPKAFATVTVAGMVVGLAFRLFG